LLWSPHRDPITYVAGLQRRYGDLVHWRIGPQDVVMVARSDLARDVLVTHHRSFKKGPGLERAQIVLGLIRPGLTLAWGGLLLCAVLAYRLVIRRRLRQVAEAYA
jgi:hypothetical protein